MSGEGLPLAKAMAVVVTTFQKYAKKDSNPDWSKVKPTRAAKGAVLDKALNDNPNTLSKGELNDLLKTELGVFSSSSDVSKLFNELDEDKDGTISFQEFMAFTVDLCMKTQEELMEIKNKARRSAKSGDIPALAAAMILIVKTFHKYAKNNPEPVRRGEAVSRGKLFDLMLHDNPNTLSKGELHHLFKAEIGADFESCVDEAEFEEIFQELDDDEDGTVCFGEFIYFTAQVCMAVQQEFLVKMNE